jgi:GTPase SAR1 family protein
MPLIVVNIAGAGASYVREKFLGKGFSSNYMMTIGAEFALKEATIGEVSVKFQIWDLQGHPRYSTVRSIYHYGRMGFIIFFKKNDRSSFEDVTLWFEEFKKHNGKPISQFSKDQLVLIGIIQELEDVTKEEGEKLAKGLGMSYYEMNPESGKTINEILHKLGEWYIHYLRMS